jgi:hypothetical protein
LKTEDTKGRGAYGSSYTYDVSYPTYVGDTTNWKHEAGLSCFTRTIDPDKYPLIKPDYRN